MAEVQLGVRRQRLQRRVLDPGRRRVVLDLLDWAHPEGPARVARQVEALQHEEARLALAAAAVITGAREKQLLPRARHPDVEEPPLFLQMEVAGRHRVLHQGHRQLQRVATATQRKLLLDQIHEVHDGKLEALGLVDGEDAHGRRLDIGFGDRRVLAGVDQLVQVLHEFAHVVVAQRPGGRLHAVEELRDVLALGYVASRLLAVHPAEPARILEEQVHQLTGRHLAAELHVAFEVLDQVADRGVTLFTDLVAQLADRLRLSEHVEEVDVPAVGVGRAAREVDDRHVIELGRRQVVETHGFVGVDQRAQERDQQPDLRAAVEPGVAGERPRNGLKIQRAQELIGVVVGSDENGDVVVAPSPGVHLLADRARDGVGLLRARLVVQVRRRRALGLANRDQVLADAAAHLETIRVVVDDEAVGRVEDLLVRPIVLGEHHLPRLGISIEERQHVGDRGAPPPINCLVVVAHARDVAVTGAQELHQLELGMVGVLELVDHDVLEAALEVAAHVGPGPQELQDQDDLVAEIDAAVAGHQLLILGVGGRQLALLEDALARFLVVGRRGDLAGEPLDIRQIFLGRDVFVLAAADERDDRADVAGRIAERPVVDQRKLEQAVAEENDLLGAVENAEIGLQPHLERMLAQDPIAERVEGRDLDVGVAVLHQRVDALLHLGRGLVGEREREDLVGTRLFLGDQPGDATGDDGGLAGAGTGHDQEGPGVVSDGLALGVVQAVEDPLSRHAVSTIRPRSVRRQPIRL